VSIVSLLPHPSSVTVGGVTNLTVTISAPQGSNTIISTSSDNTSVATVPSTVTVTAGNTTAIVPVTGVGIGSANILATLTNAVSANITVSNPSGLWPNEPAGSILLNDNNFNVVVGNSWVDYSGDTTIAVDPTAPASPSNVLRQTFHAGLQGGFGGGGGNAYNFPGGLQPDVYFGYYFKVDNNYINHPVGTKISWIHTDASLLNELFLFMEGSDPYIISAQYQNTYADNSHLGGPSPNGSIRFSPSGGSFSKNQWILIEQYYKPASGLTAQNGIWQLRINGTLTVNVSTMNTKSTTQPGAVSFITIWGGVTQTLASDSYLYYDHARVSIPNR